MAGGTLINGAEYRTNSVPRTIVDKSAPSGNRSFSLSYGTKVSEQAYNNKTLVGGNPNQTAIDVYATNGTGRSAQNLGRVGTTTVNADGSTQFVPSGRFNELPESVRNNISSKDGQTAAKTAINNAATADKLQNNLTSKGPAAPQAAAQPPAGGAGSAAGNSAAAPDGQKAIPSNFSPDTGLKPTGKGDNMLKYPLKMKQKMDYVLFRCENGGMVAIGMQPTIQDDNRQNWGESSLDPIQMGALKSAKRLIGSDDYGEQLGKELESFKKFVSDKSTDPTVKSFAQMQFAAQALGGNVSANDLTARSDVGVGMILNPNIELVYKGPALRTFSYTFRMTPREPNEAKAILQIINFFKSNMVPKSSELFFKRPYYFDIEYKGEGSKFINKIKKECALQGCSVNYTPDGSYTTYQGGSMTSYQLTLQFSETRPLTDLDYKEIDLTTQMGF
jgi:hypothetical protein